MLHQTASNVFADFVTARQGATAASATKPAPRDESADQAAVEQQLQDIMDGHKPDGTQFADSYGRVKNLALMLPKNYTDTVPGMREQVLGAYKTLFEKMEPDTKFTLIAGTDQDKADLEKLVKDPEVPNQGSRFTILEPGQSDLTVWARDMMIPKFIPGEPDKTALIAQEPLHNWHASDSQIPGEIAKAEPSIELENRTAMVTDGGDTQSNTKESFVGYYSLAATENKLHNGLENSPMKPEVINWYEGQTGKHVVETDPSTTFPFQFVPAIAADGTHITRLQDNPNYKAPDLKPGEVSDAQMFDDLAVKTFENNLGKPVTIMGRDNPATPHHEEPATDHMDMGMTPVDDHTFFVGDPGLAEKTLGIKPDRNRDNQQDFDAYAKTLQDKGYNVLRMPHLEPKKQGEPYITYNNCLMERFEKDGKEVRRVFLPEYNLPTDKVAEDVWHSQGFEVIPMQLDRLSSDWGALRCISNWLDRSPQG